MIAVFQSQEELRLQEVERQRLAEQVRDANDKRESMAQWEQQISEIIQWCVRLCARDVTRCGCYCCCCGCRVSDEKDARSYLQALAQKMNDELDSLKSSGIPTVVTALPHLPLNTA